MQRKALYEQARVQHPRRWSRQTRNWNRAHTVYLNPERADTQNKPNQEIPNQDKITA